MRIVCPHCHAMIVTERGVVSGLYCPDPESARLARRAARRIRAEAGDDEVGDRSARELVSALAKSKRL